MDVQVDIRHQRTEQNVVQRQGRTVQRLKMIVHVSCVMRDIIRMQVEYVHRVEQ